MYGDLKMIHAQEKEPKIDIARWYYGNANHDMV